MRKIDKRKVAAPKSLSKRKSYKGDDVKEALKTLYANKCAYCECNISAGAPMDVEHYRPKNKGDYPWLKFEWSNLLWACQKCNRPNSDRYANTHKRFTFGKGTHFPIQGNRVTDSSIADLDTLNTMEKPLLLNPEADKFKPGQHFYFDNKGIIYGSTDEGKTSEEIYGLNRQPLWIKRQEIIDKLLADIRFQTDQYARSNFSSPQAYYDQIKRLLDKIVARSQPEKEQEYTFWAAEIIENFDTLVLPLLEEEVRSLIREAFLKYCNSG